MISNEQRGLLELIQLAVLPLTETGEFHLESITINEYDSTVITILTSSKITINLNSGAIHSGIGCVLKNLVSKKIFLTESLFPALQLENLEVKGEYLEEFPKPISCSNDDSKNYQAKWDAIIKATGFIEKMNNLCSGIRDNLPKIQEAFLPENIDHTVKKYVAERKKIFPNITESDCELKNN